MQEPEHRIAGVFTDRRQAADPKQRPYNVYASKQPVPPYPSAGRQVF